MYVSSVPFSCVKDQMKLKHKISLKILRDRPFVQLQVCFCGFSCDILLSETYPSNFNRMAHDEKYNKFQELTYHLYTFVCHASQLLNQRGSNLLHFLSFFLFLIKKNKNYVHIFYLLMMKYELSINQQMQRDECVNGLHYYSCFYIFFTMIIKLI